MKKKLLIAALALICFAVSAFGTVAYFNSETRTHNVITTGGVEVEINEWADTGKTERFKNLKGVMPGTTVTKLVEVENTGASPAWVRMKLEKAIKLASEIPGFTPDTALIKLDINTGKWEDGGDGYLYYKDRLDPGAVTEPAFTGVTFDETMGNEYKSSKATVTVAVHAVQSANNGTDARTAAGWPAP